MELPRPGYAVVYVILLCALDKRGSEGKRWKPEEFYRDGGGLSPSLLHLNGNKAEQVWKQCRKELVDSNEDIKDFDLHPLEGIRDMRSILLIEKNIHKATKFLPSHMEQNFLDCIRKTTPTTPVSKEEVGFGHRLKKLFVSLGLASGRGRHLVAELPHNQMPPSPVPVPVPVPSSGSPSPNSHGAAPASSPLPNSHGPAPASSPLLISHGPAPASSPSLTRKPHSEDLSLPPDMFVPFPPPPPPPPPPHLKSRPIVYASVPRHDNEQQKTIIIGAAASGIIILIGLFLCCREARSNKVDKYDRTSLTLTSPNDFSGGSQNSVGLENSDKKSGINNGKDPSIVRNLSIKPEDNNTSLAETTSLQGMGEVPVSPLKPHLGRSGPPALELPRPPPPPPALAPRPPPPPRVARPPPAAPKPREQGSSSDGGESDAPKPKLKPFFWDKVPAKSDQAMVWHEISAGSFQFNEEKIESLFGCANQNRNERRKESPSLEPSVQYIQIIDHKKAQNLSILLRALNVTTEEVIDALKEGNEIPVELIQTVLKMAPTTEEELKLRLFTGDISQLGPAERFLKVLVDIPFAFKRLESLLLIFILPEEVSSIKESFATLEVSCNKLRKSRLFLKLLEAVLKTGNRMNDGTYRGGAEAFRLDTLLKLADVKGTDGKTTLLHFVVQEIIRSEGKRAVRTERANRSPSSVKTEDFVVDAYEESEEHYRSLGLQVVSSLTNELEDVKNAAIIDGDALTAAVAKLRQSLTKTEDFLNTDLKNLEEDSEFLLSLASFVEKAKADVAWLLEEEKRIMAEVKSTADYFHGNAGKDEGLRLFVIVRDFLVMLDKVCKEVKDTTMKSVKASSKKEALSVSSSPDTRHQSPSDLHRRLFPAIVERRVNYSSSDDDDESLPT